LKYRIISVSKIREPFYRQGINEYLKRLSAYTSIDIVDGLEEKINARAGDKEIEKTLQKEGTKILNLIGEHEILIVCDSKGKKISSETLAAYMGEWNMSGKMINLIIGSSHGISDNVKKRADLSISFSNLTFPHQMAVLILTEQIYRGYKILKGEPYFMMVENTIIPMCVFAIQ